MKSQVTMVECSDFQWYLPYGSLSFRTRSRILENLRPQALAQRPTNSPNRRFSGCLLVRTSSMNIRPLRELALLFAASPIMIPRRYPSIEFRTLPKLACPRPNCFARANVSPRIGTGDNVRDSSTDVTAKVESNFAIEAIPWSQQSLFI